VRRHRQLPLLHRFAADWPLASIVIAIGAALGYREGGYFPTDWGWSSLVLLWTAAIALFVRERLPLGRLEAAMLAAFAGFIGWIAVSSAWSTSLERPILEVQRDLVYLGGLLTVFLVARRRSVAVLLAAVCGTAMLVSTFALVKFLFPDRFQLSERSLYRLSEPLGYPNALGLIAAIGALLAVSFAAHAHARRDQALSATCFVVFSLTIFLTSSRGAWVSLAAGLVAMLLLDSRRLVVLRTLATVAPVASVAVWLGSRAHALTTPGARPSEAAHQGHVLALATVLLAATAALAAVAVAFATRRIVVGRRGSIAAVGAALVLLVGASALALGRYQSRPGVGSEARLPQANTSLTLSLSGRLPLWRQAWHDWEGHRALGSGGGTFEQYWLEHRRTSAFVRDAHSLYLETLAELGPVGLVLLSTALALPLLALRKVRVQPYVPGAFAAYLAYLIHAGGDWDWEMPAVTLLGLFCGTALVLAARPDEPPVLSRRARAVPLAVTLALVAVAFAGLIGNGALQSSARAADARRWAESDSQARKATRWLPWSSEAWRHLAIAQSNEGQLEAARASARKAVAKGPDEWRPWLTLMRLSTGLVERHALRQAARLNRHDPEVVQFRLAPGSLNQRWSYDDSWIGWPVAPTHEPHPIRAAFLDPRAGTLRTGGEPAYHFGIDIGVRDDRPEAGAPPGRSHRVYAIEGGSVDAPTLPPRDPCVNRKVLIGHFSYWHVDPVVAYGQRVQPGQMIGWTCKGLWHVHLAELLELYGRRVYVNPVHPGMKLGPYPDDEPPRIRAIEFFRPAMPRWVVAGGVSFPASGTRFPEVRGRAVLSGRADVRAWVDDPEPSGRSAAVPRALGSANPPDRISLQVMRGSDRRPFFVRTVFRAAVFLGNSAGTQAVPISYHYAPGTKHALPAELCLKLQPRNCTSTYWFRLFARPASTYWETTRLPDGDYRLRVTASDAAGNAASRVARVTIRNARR
jgi:O-antigen ligase/polysaccharide polymerase Wzy-like membrane protein